MNGAPTLVEAFGPGVQRKRVMAAQVFDVEYFEPAAIHRIERLRQAGYPAAGKDVLANVEIGVETAHVPDEVNDPEPAGFEALRVRKHDFVQLVPSGML